MNIDITDLKSRDIIKILQSFSQGHLEIKFERIFWSSDYSEPDLPREESSVRAFDPRRPPQGKGGVGKSFERMADTLGSMVC
jgi:hypothetical protein